MSQRQLAEAMAARGYQGWRQGTVSTTEAGQRPLRVNELVALADIFGASLEAIVQRDPFHGLTLAAAQEELASLTAEMESLEKKIVAAKWAAQDARQAAEEAQERARRLHYQRTEITRLIRLLQEFIEQEGGRR